MPSNPDDHPQEPAAWQPLWRRGRTTEARRQIEWAMNPWPEIVGAIGTAMRFRHIQDLCRLVGFPFRLPEKGAHDILDPSAAIERLERYAEHPTLESAAAAREAIVQFVRTLPADPGAVRYWEVSFARRDMTEFLPDRPGGS